VTAYDVIGDVHGHADELERLLAKMGYRESHGAFRHPTRTVVFVGDLIDRGPRQLRTLDIARRMVDAGSGLMVLGNHEFNAVAWATLNEAGEWCRPHTKKNHSQHAAFLDAVVKDPAEHRQWIDWFASLPLWLDLGGLRVVHACWHPDSMKTLGGSTLSRSAITAASGDPLHEAIEIILKGPEVHLGDISYADNDGNPRDKARIRWWDPSATTVATAAVLPGGATSWGGSPLPPLPDSPLQLDFLPADNLNTPVLYGHYWRNGINPTIDNTRSACLDWSIAKGGQLVAYRWSGETDLTNDHLVAVS
jgi:hypothetical protein